MRRLAIFLLPLVSATFVLSAVPAQAVTTVDWLCRPGLADNPCEIPLDTTVQQKDGSLVVETPDRLPAQDRPVDCFYVYPTVSNKITLSSAPATATPEVKTIAKYEAARYSSVCRTYAPLYRQVSLPSVVFGPLGSAKNAYEDVLAAWKDYITNDNDGRGFILIGHGEGAALLRKLIQQEIDDDPVLRDRMVGAVLLGGNVLMKKGERYGGDFQNIESCKNYPGGALPGCVIGLSSYTNEPVALVSLFGNTLLDPMTLAFGLHGVKGGQVLCTDVPNLVPGNDHQQVTVPVEKFGSDAVIGFKQLGEYAKVPNVTTTWVTTSDTYQGFCRSRDLSATVWWYSGDPGTKQTPVQWPLLGGTHYFDANLGLDLLVSAVDDLTNTWLSTH